MRHRPSRSPGHALGGCRHPLLPWPPSDLKAGSERREESAIPSVQGRPSRAADGLVERVGAVTGVVRRRRLAAAARPVLDVVAESAGLRRDDLVVRSSAVGRTGSVTFVVRSGTDDLIVKLARDRAPAASLGRAATVQTTLRDDVRLTGLRAHIPSVVATGVEAGWTWLVERALPGRPVAGGRLAPGAAERILAVIGQLHAATIRPLDPTQVAETWLTTRLRGVADLLGDGRGATAVAASPADVRVAPALLAIEREVSTVLAGPVAGGWIHGDLWAANVLFDGTQPSGLVDWDSASDGEAPEQDLLHLVLFARRARHGGSLGTTLRAVLDDGWAPEDRAVLDMATTTTGLAPRPTLWLYWLRFVEVNLVRVPSLARDRRWIEQNVLQVLA